MTAQPMDPKDVPDEWVMLAVHAHGDANHKVLCDCDTWPEGCYGGFTRDQWEHGNEAYTIAAVAPLIRAQVADEIAAEADDYENIDVPGDRDADLPGVAGNSYWRAACTVNGLRIAQKIARGDQ